MKFLILSLVVFVLAAAAKAQQTTFIPCNFFSSDGFYNCQITNLAVADNEDQDFVFSGQHQPFMGDENVSRILVSNSSIPFIISQLFTTFPNVRVYDNNNGGLNRIQPGSFTNGKALSILSIVNNPALRRIEIETFRSAPNIFSMILLGNGIESIDPRAFEGLNRLVSLVLRGNQIQHFDANVFSSLATLQSIDIASNRLESLHGSLLSNNSAISFIDIANNQINSIGRNFLDSSPQLRVMFAMNNRCVNGQWTISGNVTVETIRSELSTCFSNFENQPQPEEELRRFIIEVRGPLSLFFENGTEIVRV